MVCLGVIIFVLVSIELVIWGYLSLGGGFVVGVVGGIVIGLIVIILLLEEMEKIYKRWNVVIWEKIFVLVFIVLVGIILMGWELFLGILGEFFSGGIIFILNILVVIKVVFGLWVVILLFICYWGLLWGWLGDGYCCYRMVRGE